MKLASSTDGPRLVGPSFMDNYITDMPVKATRSERQAGKPSVPVADQRRRICQALQLTGKPLSASAMALVAFPDFTFRSLQGAALAISRTVRGLYDDHLVTAVTRGYQITDMGREWLSAAHAQQDDVEE